MQPRDIERIKAIPTAEIDNRWNTDVETWKLLPKRLAGNVISVG
jgi:hypothetical protein